MQNKEAPSEELETLSREQENMTPVTMQMVQGN